MNKKIIWGGLLGVCIIGLAAFNVYNVNKSVEVRLGEATEGRIVEQIYTNGKLEPREVTDYFAHIGGTVEQVGIKKGDVVTEGQVLFKFHVEDVKEQLEMERINLQMIVAERASASKQYFENFKKLKQEDPNQEIEKLDLSQYDLRLKNSKVKIESLERKLNNDELKAKTPGVVTEVAVSEGQMVAQGSPVATIADLTSFQVKANLNELDAGKIEPGMDAVVTGDSIEGVYKGKVTYISPIAVLADQTSRDPSVEMIVSLDNTASELRSGYNVTVEFEIPDRTRILVPIDAVVHAGDKSYVYKVADNKAVKVEVTTGKENEEHIEIVSGVASGEQIVVEGAERLDDGIKVSVR